MNTAELTGHNRHPELSPGVVTRMPPISRAMPRARFRRRCRLWSSITLTARPLAFRTATPTNQPNLRHVPELASQNCTCRTMRNLKRRVDTFCAIFQAVVAKESTGILYRISDITSAPIGPRRSVLMDACFAPNDSGTPKILTDTSEYTLAKESHAHIVVPRLPEKTCYKGTTSNVTEGAHQNSSKLRLLI